MGKWGNLSLRFTSGTPGGVVAAGGLVQTLLEPADVLIATKWNRKAGAGAIRPDGACVLSSEFSL